MEKSDHDEEIASLHQLKDSEEEEFIAAQFMGSSLAYFDASIYVKNCGKNYELFTVKLSKR